MKLSWNLVCIAKLRRDIYPSHSVEMGNLLRVLNDKGHVPKVNLFVDFESELEQSSLWPCHESH